MGDQDKSDGIKSEGLGMDALSAKLQYFRNLAYKYPNGGPELAEVYNDWSSIYTEVMLRQHN